MLGVLRIFGNSFIIYFWESIYVCIKIKIFIRFFFIFVIVEKNFLCNVIVKSKLYGIFVSFG